jgi:hypothetical protein
VVVPLVVALASSPRGGDAAKRTVVVVTPSAVPQSFAEAPSVVMLALDAEGRSAAAMARRVRQQVLISLVEAGAPNEPLQGRTDYPGATLCDSIATTRATPSTVEGLHSPLAERDEMPMELLRLPCGSID